jgi:hypothetical protein
MKPRLSILTILLSIVSMAFAAPNYHACNMCQLKAQNNPMMSCDQPCKGIAVSDIIPEKKSTVPANAPFATAAGCQACHLCRVQAANAYAATNCIDQCNSCHVHDPFTGLDPTKAPVQVPVRHPAKSAKPAQHNLTPAVGS